MKLKTRLRSQGMRYFSSASYMDKQRNKARKAREKQNKPPIVHYFHQVDDPYSHLAAQKLPELKSRYNIEFATHLVSKPEDAFQGSTEHFETWALRDAASVAEAYGVTFAPTINHPPSENAIDSANATLANELGETTFAQTAVEVGEALWADVLLESSNSQAGAQSVQQGNALRTSLGHYLGAMFYFDGEWFWGVDRLRLLEQRLVDEQFAVNANDICVPEPTPIDTSGMDTGDILLEYFPSLRSPYTAIGHQRVLALIERSGVKVKVRPVMPMMMRGVPAPRAKQRYIITDAAREGRVHDSPLGRIVDPFGEPVKQAFKLFPGAASLGCDMAYVTAYLRGAWQDGIDITTEKGLRQVAQNANIDWSELQQASAQKNWEQELDDNLQAMLNANLWGVPSFRVSGGNKPADYVCWGQDRIWRVENEIAKRA